MSVVLEAEVLAGALKRAAGVVAGRNTIAILANVRLEADDDGLRVLTTDLDVGYAERVPVVTREGSLCTTVDAKRLAALVGAVAKGAQVKLAMDGAQLAVSSGRSRWKLNALPVTDFPKMPAENLDHRLDLSGKALAAAIARVLWSRSDESTRYYLNGPLWHAAPDGQVRMVATNGHTLALVPIAASWPTDAPQAILGPKFCQVAQALCGEVDGTVTLAWSASKMRLSAGDVEVLGKTIEGTFPDYMRVVPPSEGVPVVVEPELLRGAVRRVALVGQGKTRSVRIERAAGALRISAQSNEVGSGAEDVPAEVEQGFEAGFNSQYLDQMLDAIGGDSVEIHHSDARNPAMIRRSVDDGALGVVMPMRV